MKNNYSLIYSFFLMIGDCLALVAAFASAYILRVTVSHRVLEFPVHARTYLSVFLVLLPFWILLFFLLGLYQTSIHEKRFNETGRLLVGSFIGMLFVVFWNFLAPKPIIPARLVPIYGFILAFVFLIVFRNLARTMRVLANRAGWGITNVLIVGNTHVATQLVDMLSDSRRSGYQIVGLVSNLEDVRKYPHIKVFTTFDQAAKSLASKQLNSIVQTELYANPDQNNEVLNFAQSNHIAYRFIPGNAELFVGNLQVDLFRQSIPMIAVHQTALLGWGQVIKRIFDLLVGSLLLIVASPFILIIAILQKLTTRGPVFFRQERLTRFNEVFKVFKFRTLKLKYNGLLPEEGFAKMGRPELAKEFRENGDYLTNDPRLTRFGRLLRRTSLDEIPQLFNVIKGDLSLVGPRALVQRELDKHEKRHAILSVKSGLTGLAQVSGRKSITFEERRQLDVYYVQNWSFWLDLSIILKTIRVILQGD